MVYFWLAFWEKFFEIRFFQGFIFKKYVRIILFFYFNFYSIIFLGVYRFSFWNDRRHVTYNVAIYGSFLSKFQEIIRTKVVHLNFFSFV